MSLTVTAEAVSAWTPPPWDWRSLAGAMNAGGDVTTARTRFHWRCLRMTAQKRLVNAMTASTPPAKLRFLTHAKSVVRHERSESVRHAPPGGMEGACS
jgi:hypothetical protein